MRILFALLLLNSPAFVQAEDWTTTDGKTYSKVTIIDHDGNEVDITCTEGNAAIALSHLPASIQKRIDDDHVTSKDWATTDGKVYKGVKVTRHDDDGISILDDEGGATIPWEHLPLDLQLHYGHDPVKVAAAREAAEKARQVEATKQQQAQDDQIADLEAADTAAVNDYAKAAKVNLTGQIFIATKGGESIKLSLVHLNLYSELQAQRRLAALTCAGKSIMDSLKPTIEQEKARYLEACIDYNYANSDEDHDQQSAAMTQLGADLRKSYLYMSQDYYIEGMGSPIASATSDADGRFSLPVPSDGGWVVMARTQRAIGEDNEFYFWAFKITSSDMDAKSLFLDNENLAAASNSLALIDPLDETQIQDAVTADIQKIDDYARDHPRQHPPPEPPPPPPEKSHLLGPGSL